MSREKPPSEFISELRKLRYELAQSGFHVAAEYVEDAEWKMAEYDALTKAFSLESIKRRIRKISRIESRKDFLNRPTQEHPDSGSHDSKNEET